MTQPANHDEVVAFLGSQPPYDRLDDDDVERLACAATTETYARGATVVEADGPPLDHLYVVRSGAVELTDRGRTIDVLTVGDTFGHISVLSGLPPPLQARASEDTTCYRLPNPLRLLQHAERLQFAHYGTLVARDRVISSGATIARLERPIHEVMHPITWCEASDTVRDVAVAMTRAGRSCALYRDGGRTGIVTDDDFRRRVATGDVVVDAPVSLIGSSPAISMSAENTVSTAYLFMVERGIHHLVVDDAAGNPIGVTRVVDMATAEVRNPLMIRTAIASAVSVDDLAETCRLLTPTTVELWESGVAAEHLGRLLSAMVEAVYVKAIELCVPATSLADFDCSWMLLGSLGRREPLPNSDLDTAVAWVGPVGESVSRERSAAGAEPLIAALAHCGLQPCPKGLNASSPLFSRPSQQWRDVAQVWRTEPEDVDHLLLASTMLDARPVTRPTLVQGLRNSLTAGSGRDGFSRALMDFALNDRPPSGFVRGFVVGHFGEQRSRLNLKRAGLRPVASLARALAHRTGDVVGTTPQRLAHAHQAGLLSVEEADTLVSAFRLCYQVEFDAQVTAIREGGSFQSGVDPLALDNSERRHLRSAFRAVSQIQDRFGKRSFV
ncbi:cyclic nucleotide-binding domain-containing protein [Mycolicibacterium sp. S2-37]|uniref:putative nucleotidyltransferase substrate binding domain-containing protein n=1 Tax=Mycolicibacterium sp. S2-37 TaxID=2810297 RepID=UPI001A93AD0B|nr:putative nucleotidyltransferase substrate binding domain-containing protein [Mycolicibacterium sp. S2-37]MBO0678267.1 cyclic nucleotide-binding domain-containing protein [Mycolicibacterium sp. S2-37]